MSIELHCQRCSKLIRAPDDAGGKRGKCPYCGAEVYVPTHFSDDEIIPIAPIDPQEEQREAEMRREAASYAASLDKAQDVRGEEGGRGSAGPPGAGAPAPPGDVVDIGAEVEAFVLAMRDSKLDDADSVVARLQRTGARARDYVEGLMLDQMPPKIEGVPPPLMQGFLKALLERLG
jgi:hypothetical protein